MTESLPKSTSTAVSEEVGSTLLFENDRVRVWDLRLAPGENLGMHRHASEYFLVAIGGGKLKSLNADGSTRFVADMEDGEVHYRNIKGEDVHDAVNVGQTPWRNLVVEMKD
jgi:hypothetical protein